MGERIRAMFCNTHQYIWNTSLPECPKCAEARSALVVRVDDLLGPLGIHVDKERLAEIYPAPKEDK